MMNMEMKSWLEGVEGKLEQVRVTAEEARGIGVELAQKMVRGGGGGGEAAQTWGNAFIESKSADFEHLRRGKTTIGLDLATKTTITSAAGSGNDLIVPERDQLLGLPQRRRTVRALMSTVRVSSNAVEYPRQTTRPAGAAAQTAEGAAIAESAMAFDLATAYIRTIAHWIPASMQVLDDAPMLSDLIDTELRYGLAIKEEEQLLFGSGTGQNLTGLVTAATGFDTTTLTTLGLGSTPTRLDRLGAAIYQAALSEVPPDGIVMHPADWWAAAQLSKDAAGGYILANPAAQLTPTLWGLPVVVTQAMTVGRFLVGAFKAQTLYDRMDPRVEVSTEHADFFTRLLVAIRAVQRIGTAVKRPTALVSGTFS